jgi:mannan endo-1,4-beta-mannosidase
LPLLKKILFGKILYKRNLGMKKTIASVVLAFSFLFVMAQKSLIDTKATAETKKLYQNLSALSKQHILFGHQHATEYGHGWSGDDSFDKSDVKSVTGSHPAVIGVDFMDAFGAEGSNVEQRKEALRKNITATYNRGGITTVSWHFNNPASAGGFYWKDSVSLPSVKLIIPGGSHHEKYKSI